MSFFLLSQGSLNFKRCALFYSPLTDIKVNTDDTLSHTYTRTHARTVLDTYIVYLSCMTTSPCTCMRKFLLIFDLSKYFDESCT